MTITAATSGFISYLDVIDSIINIEGRKNTIPGYSREDIAQEVRLECLRVLEQFNPKRIGPSPYKYLQICVRNFLYNMRRGIYVPNNPPCTRCPLWDKTKRNCIIQEIGCDRIKKYKSGMSKKAAIKTPSSLEFDVLDFDDSESIDLFILDDSIKTKLPIKLKKYYDKLKLGKKIPIKIHNQIKEIVKDICREE